MLGAAVWVLVRTVGPNWHTIIAARLTIRWGWLVAASGVWLVSFIFLVRLWTLSLAWWHERLGALAGLRMFVLSNLARYIPGAVWQFAGLAALAVEARVSPLAVTGAVLVQQFVLLVTGILLSLAFASTLLGSPAALLLRWVSLPVGALGVGLVTALLVFGWPQLRRRLSPVFQRGVPLPSWESLAAYVAGSVVGWVGYGTAFWLLGRALLGSAAPGVLLAAPAFVASYVIGIVAVIAPGGIVVREAALVTALRGALGADRAFLLAIAARLWLTVLEILTALVLWAWGGRRPGGGEVVAPPFGRRWPPGRSGPPQHEDELISKPRHER